MDPATGELTGVIKDYVELAKDCLQVKFQSLPAAIRCVSGGMGDGASAGDS